MEETIDYTKFSADKAKNLAEKNNTQLHTILKGIAANCKKSIPTGEFLVQEMSDFTLESLEDLGYEIEYNEYASFKYIITW